MRFRFRELAVAAALITLGGCATVTSGRTGAMTADVAHGGVSYFLPTRLARITASRVPVVLADLKKARDAKATAVQALRTASETATANKVAAEALLASLNADTTTRADSRDAQARAVDAARAAERVAAAALATGEEALAVLNAGVNVAETAGVACTYTAKVELLTAQADPNAHFIARFAHSPLRDDIFTLKINGAGLLSNANVVADDRSGQILVDAAGAWAGAGVDVPVIGPPSAPAGCAEMPRDFELVFDPVNDRDRNALNASLIASGFPLSVDLRTGDLNPGDGGVSHLSTVTANHRASNGLFYRTPVPVAIVLNQRVGDRSQPIDGAVFMLPQAGPVGFIPLESSAFVRTVDDVQFADGSISSWTANRPSEVAEFVRLPVRILREVISVPAALFKLRVDLSNDVGTLAARQQTEILEQEEHRRLVACLARIRNTDESLSVCTGD